MTEKPDESVRIIIPMPEELVRRIDAERRYAEGDKIPSRAEIVRVMLDEAIRARSGARQAAGE